MKPTEDDEQPPFPSDHRTGWEIAGVYTRAWFWLLAWPVGVVGLLLIFSQAPFGDYAWGRWAFKGLLFCGGIIALVFGLMAFNLALSFLSLPFRRKRATPEAPRRMARLSPAQIEDEIADAREVLGFLRDPRKRRGWQRWLAWLERQSNVPPAERSTLAPGVYHAKKPAWIKASLGGVFMVALTVWLTWDRDPWARWGIAGFVGLIVVAGPAVHFGERLELTDDSLSYYRFGRLRWTVPREHIATKAEDIETSSYELYDLRTGKWLGSVSGPSFGAEIVEALVDLFPPLIKREEA